LERTPPEGAVGGRGHDILDVVMTDDLQIAFAANLLAPSGDGRNDVLTVEKRSSLETTPDVPLPREPEPFCAHGAGQRGYPRVVEIEESKIIRRLIFEYTAFRGDIFIDRVVPILMIHRH